jgi:signal recognition particle receptor subunit alpha
LCEPCTVTAIFLNCVRQSCNTLPGRGSRKARPRVGEFLVARTPSLGKNGIVMIDDFTIFSRSGLILWRKSFVKLRGDPLARLVQTVLLEDRAALPELVCDGSTVRWLLDNNAGLVYALVFQTALPPAYAADLLASVRTDFGRRYADAIADPAVDDYADFDVHFERLLRAAEDHSLSRAAAARSVRAGYAPSSLPKDTSSATASDASAQYLSSSSSSALHGTYAASSLSRHSKLRPDATTRVNPSAASSAESDTAANASSEPSKLEATEDAEEVIRRNREAFLKKRMGGGPRSKKSAQVEDKPAIPSGSNGKRGKTPRVSDTDTVNDMEALDFSADKPTGKGGKDVDPSASDAEVARFMDQFLRAKPNTAYTTIEDESTIDQDQDAAGAAGSDSGANRGGVFDFFKGLAGMKNLERRDLEPALAQFRDALIGKNVAQDIADHLMESVAISLEGKRMETMTSVSSTVRKALDDALTRILTPRQSVDILADISAKRGSGRPYVITFCGVNGVGKSTSLAKTCFYLINNGYKVMIAACDTFRAGAVEQLRTHVRCLGENVELFDRGYGKDAASVAMEAVRRAKELRYDVVLIDTAGRMQDNEPLMRALSKLVEVNQPDRVFFVGEALVGNDAVDQLKKFNSALADHQKSATPRLIDGIVLTKFDTIDDKVGAAVSMVYTTGQPIVFVGVGQTYMDLRKVNTKSLVKALLK